MSDDDKIILRLNGTDLIITPVYEKDTLYLLASLTVLLTWVVFSPYFSRFIGVLISSLVNYYMRFSKIDGALSIDSFSISPLAGKIAFRGVVYACDDYSIRLNDGFILLAYWKFMPNTRAAKCCTSRLSVHINGLQVYVYNQLSRCREVTKVLRMLNVIGEEVKTEVVTEEKSSFVMSRFWSFVGVVKVACTSGKIVLGNPLIPYMMVLNLENLKSEVLLEESKKDKKLINCKCSMENVRLVLQENPSFTGVHPDPPRTVGDGFILMQTLELTLVYFDYTLGKEKGADQGLAEENRPVLESICRFGRDTQFAYGEWADRQRHLLLSFFLPPVAGIAPVERIPMSHEARVFLLYDSTLNIEFTRGGELESIQLRLPAGSFLEATIWWSTNEQGWSCQGSILNQWMQLMKKGGVDYRVKWKVSRVHYTQSPPRQVQPWNYQCERFGAGADGGNQKADGENKNGEGKNTKKEGKGTIVKVKQWRWPIASIVWCETKGICIATQKGGKGLSLEVTPDSFDKEGLTYLQRFINEDPKMDRKSIKMLAKIKALDILALQMPDDPLEKKNPMYVSRGKGRAQKKSGKKSTVKKEENNVVEVKKNGGTIDKKKKDEDNGVTERAIRPRKWYDLHQFADRDLPGYVRWSKNPEEGARLARVQKERNEENAKAQEEKEKKEKQNEIEASKGNGGK